MWGADLAVIALRPLAALAGALFGFTGIDVGADGGWVIGTRLTAEGAPFSLPLTTETLRRLLLGAPLTAAFLLAPPRPARPWRALAIAAPVLAVVFALSIVLVAWGEMAPMLNPALASASLMVTAQLDQPPLHPLVAQVAIVGRYVALSIVPLLTALILWAALNPFGLKTLAAEIRDGS